MIKPSTARSDLEIPQDVSRVAEGVQISPHRTGEIEGYTVHYGGSLGSEWFPTLAEAKSRLAEWAERRAIKLDKQATALRHIAALCNGKIGS